MKKTIALFLFLSIGILFLMLGIFFAFDMDIPILNPKGWIALQQRDLLVLATLLMLIVVVPVLILTFAFVYKYRSENKQAAYHPDWDHSALAETIWWSIPAAIIIVLGVITWYSTHELDPYKPLRSEKQLLTIQVVALDWKWLFIYPQQGIATVNYLRLPTEVPVRFEITADAPMNSFWIPQLSGQIYAMPKMRTMLHIIADEPGEYRGSSANLSGKGFAGMHFIATAVPQKDFEEWTESMKRSSNRLSFENYLELSKPSEHNRETSYVLEKPDLFDWILMKYMHPMPQIQEAN